MNSDEYKQDLRNLRERNRTLSLAVLALAIALAVVAMWGIRTLASQRTVLMPTAPQKAFTVTGDHADKAYLEEMATYFAWLILDVSPESVGWKKDMLLRFTLPEEAAAFRTRMDLEAERLRKINGSTIFAPRQLKTDEKAQTVTLYGTEQVRVNGAETSNLPNAYNAVFVVIEGRIHLKSFEKVSDEQKPNSQPGTVGMR